MFSHIMLGANDIEQSKNFYDAIMAVLGYDKGVIDEKGRCFYISSEGVFALTKPINGDAASAGNGMTIGFNVADPAMGDAWHAAGLANGGTSCEDAPGIRVAGESKLYLAYLRDPAGNKICATHYVK
ncbi:VOC family protein [Vibrio sp. S11_S32]|uniref:VOC family protein n=1 Tax=Vibrio sp. S11_S32 TaxID=2720225 RepID=UPI001680DD4E|nr:VOC family protein [Vibrio sp. S11_S32]MBD1577252.1 VOC family protein [Vibrio sp. S11_S32]